MTQEERMPTKRPGKVRLTTKSKAVGEIDLWLLEIDDFAHTTSNYNAAKVFDDVDEAIVKAKAHDRKNGLKGWSYSAVYTLPQSKPAALPAPAATPSSTTYAEKSRVCNTCGSDVSGDCKKEGVKAGVQRWKCNDFRNQMDWGPYVENTVSHARKNPKDYVLAQKVGDTGFPRIPQDELLEREDIKLLLQMLGHKRPAGSKTENAYIEKYIVPLGSKRDKHGNRWVWIKKPDGSDPDILFSSHTDTVHREDGQQQVVVGDGRAWSDDANCLGADDTVGNWLMIEMIKAKVPGLYIFHREEEVGGNGSRWVRDNKQTSLSKMKAAIAFDRKAYTSIITRQGGMRCCSDAFAKSLSAVLGGSFVTDTGGTFTDTKNYIDHIGECTNVSVGYHNQHGPTEWQELSFAVGLKQALIQADWSKLTFERKPGEKETWGRYGGGAPYGSYYDWWDYNSVSNDPPAAAAKPAAKPKSRAQELAATYARVRAKDIELQLKETLDFVQSFPETVAHFLLEKGWNSADMEEWYTTEGQEYPGADTWDLTEVHVADLYSEPDDRAKSAGKPSVQ